MVNRPIAVIMAAMLILVIAFISLNNISSSSSGNSTAFAQQPFRFNPFRESINYTFGAISSVQDDSNGKPAWILTGFWKTNLINYTATTMTKPTSSANRSTAQEGGANVFTASFRMIMTNGSGMHTHTMTDFILKNKSMPNKTTTVFNGTASASMREGIIPDVPISIKVMDNRVISIWLDPAKVKNHFGSTPIFGIVFKREMGPSPSLLPQPPNMRMPVR